MKLRRVLLLAVAICFHDHLVVSLMYRRRVGNVVRERGPGQLKTAGRQILGTVAKPTTGFTTVKEAIHQQPNSRKYLTSNGNQNLPPKKGNILGASTVVHPTAKAKKIVIVKRLKITKHQGHNSIRTKSPKPSLRNNHTSSQSQSLPAMKGNMWRTSKVVHPTTKAKKTVTAKLLKITKHQGQNSISTKSPKPSLRNSLTSNGHQTLLHMKEIMQTTSHINMVVHPKTRAEKTKIAKMLKITMHQGQNSLRAKLTKYNFVEAKPTDMKHHKKVEVDSNRNQENLGQKNDGKKYKTSNKNHWIDRPTFSEHPHSGYFGVTFILVIVLTLIIYGLYHNRQRIMVLVIEGRHPDSRPNSAQYRKLEDAMPSFKRI